MLAAGDGAATRIFFQHELSGRAGQRRVELLLESRTAGVVDVHTAQHTASEVAGRVEPLRLLEQVDARELEIRHLLRGRVVDLAGEVHELLVRRRELTQQRVLIDSEHGRERGGFGLRVRDQPRVGPHRVLRHRQREVVAVAVEQRPSIGRERHRTHAL